MAGKIMELALAIKGKIDSSIPASVRSATQAVAELKNKMQSLGKIDIKVNKFQELSARLSEAGSKLTEAKTKASELSSEFEKAKAATEQYKVQIEQAKLACDMINKSTSPEAYARARQELINLNAAYRSSNAAAKSLARDLAAANREVNSADSAYNKAQIAVSKLSAELRKAGFDTDSFSTSQNRLRQELSDTEAALQREQKTISQHSATQDKYRKAQENLAKAQNNFFAAGSTLQLGISTVQQVAEPIISATEAAMKFESAMADVRKVVDFDTPQQFQQMNNDILSLSRSLPMAAEDIAKIVAAGGQSGIAREDLMQFAEAATKMGIAFDVSADQAGDMMAKWRTAFKLSQPEVVALADKINYLGNTTAASAPLISDVVTRIGPLGEIGGVASGEIAAMGASMVGAGVQSDVAATAIKNLILSLTAGEAATKSQKEAYNELGLDYMEVAQGMQTNSRETILKIMQSLQSLDKVKQASVMSNLFGKESLGAIAPLLSNLDALTENFNRVGDASQYAGSMEAEYTARSQTTENQLQLAKNTISAMAVSVGSALLPAINKIMSAFAPVAAAFADFAANNQTFIVVLTGIAAAITGVIMAMLAISAAIALWGLLSTTYATVTTAIRATAIAQGVLNAVMALNPFVLIAMAIAALVAALIYLWNTNDGFRDAVISAWNTVRDTALSIFSSIAGFLQNVWAGIVSAAQTAWSAVAPVFEAAWSVIKTIATGIFVAVALIVLTVMEQVVTVVQAGVNMLMAAWDVLSPYIEAVWNVITMAISLEINTITSIAQVYIDFVTAGWNVIQSVGESAWNAISATVSAVWAVIGPTVEAGAAEIMALWEQISSTASAAWNAIIDTVSSVWSTVQGIVGEGVALVEEKWNHLKEIFSSPINAVVNFIRGGSSDAQSAAATAGASAEGGVFTKPYLTWVAEAGDSEVIVPINNTSRAMSLWQTAGRMLGAYHPAAKIANAQTGTANARSVAGMQMENVADLQLSRGGDTAISNNTFIGGSVPEQNVTIEFSPNVTINADSSTDNTNIAELVKQALDAQRAKLEAELPRLLAGLKSNERRLSYA